MAKRIDPVTNPAILKLRKLMREYPDALQIAGDWNYNVPYLSTAQTKRRLEIMVDAGIARKVGHKNCNGKITNVFYGGTL